MRGEANRNSWSQMWNWCKQYVGGASERSFTWRSCCYHPQIAPTGWGGTVLSGWISAGAITGKDGPNEFCRVISLSIREVIAILLTATFGLPEVLILTPLLWVYHVTDGPSATVLGFNLPDTAILKKMPRRSSNNLINSWTFFKFRVVKTYVGFVCIGAFACWYIFYQSSVDGHTWISWDQLSSCSYCTNKVNDFDSWDL